MKINIKLLGIGQSPLAGLLRIAATTAPFLFASSPESFAGEANDIMVGKVMPTILLRDIRISVTAISRGADPLPVEFSVAVPTGKCVFTGSAQGHLTTEKISVHADKMTCTTAEGQNAYQVNGYLIGDGGGQGIKAAIEKADNGLFLVLKKDVPIGVLLTVWPKPV